MDGFGGAGWLVVHVIVMYVVSDRCACTALHTVPPPQLRRRRPATPTQKMRFYKMNELFPTTNSTCFFFNSSSSSSSSPDTTHCHNQVKVSSNTTHPSSIKSASIVTTTHRHHHVSTPSPVADCVRRVPSVCWACAAAVRDLGVLHGVCTENIFLHGVSFRCGRTYIWSTRCANKLGEWR